MPFLSVSPYNFRNLDNRSINLDSKEIYFVGENGQGKSNLLESLYYSAYGSSFRTHLDSDIICKGKDEMGLYVLFREDNGITHTTRIIIKERIKKIEKDGKIIHDRKDLINTMPCVLYSHEDMDFVIGSPERRRFFMDQSLSMYDVSYIDELRRYRKILKNRNICLKERKYEILDSYNVQFAQIGIEIQKKRMDAVFRFNQIFGRLYEQIIGISGVSIKYIPSWKSTDKNILSVEEVKNHLIKICEQEKILGFSISGPHRDKIVFERQGFPFVPTASMGQRRLIALILRTGQAIFYSQITGKKPVLLMDDVLLELDPEKRKKVTSLLPDYDQLFCTFLIGEPYEKYKKEDTIIYEIRNGEWNII